MATYAIGDVQGCYQSLCDLLEAVDYNSAKDTLWFTGDLVNRGPDSLATLRFAFENRDRIKTVLGNHDLHLLAVYYHRDYLKKKDTLEEILQAKECDTLCRWLLQQPLLHYDEKLNYTMVHAGIPPVWDLHQARLCAREVESVLQGENPAAFFAQMYGDKPQKWQDDLSGYDRLRLITNYLTRMRFCKRNSKLNLNCKSQPGTQPWGYRPWFEWPKRKTAQENIIFGHWAALEGVVDTPHVFALDTGCVWGGKLTAMRLEDRQRFAV